MSIVRPVTAALFVSAVCKRLFNRCAAAPPRKNRRAPRSPWSLKTGAAQAMSLLLIISLLTVSTPAAPTGLLASIGELGQDLRYSYLAGGLAENLSSSAFSASPVLGLLTGRVFKNKGKKQENRAAAVARIEIAPGQAVIREGEQLALTAVGYDEKNIPVQGVGFNWTALPLPLTDASAAQLKIPAEGAGVAEPLPTGVFDPDNPGIYTITAQANGSNLTSSIQVTVVPDAPLKALREISQKRPDNQQNIKLSTGKPKTLRSAVTNLMAQPLPAPVDNSTRMTKETVKDLDKWDEERKQQQKKIPSEPLPVPATPFAIAALLDFPANPARPGGPSADQSAEVPTEALAMTVAGQITGIDPITHIVTGWAYDSPYGVYAYYYIDGTYINAVYASGTGCPPTGGNCSFSFTIPDTYVDSQQHTLTVDAGYSHVPLASSPQNFTFAVAPGSNWNNSNWYTADDPGLQPGNPANTGTAEAGSENFGFSAPVVSLGGRGLNVNLSLSYNSLLWHQANGAISYDIDKGNPGPGWSLLGIGKMMDMGSAGGSMIEDQDGTRHSYAGSLQSGFSGTLYYGHTTDGSFIDYNSFRSTNGITGGGAHFPNGTSISYGAAAADGSAVYPTQIKDRNGNYITITYVNNQGPNISTITDTEGRVIQFQYDVYNYLLSVSGPAINPTGIEQNQNATQTYVRIHHRHQPLSYNFSGLTPLVRDSNPYVIDAIYYPGTNTGYWFGDADSYSTYGMLAKVVEQRGMSWTAGQTGQDQGTFTPGVMTRQMTYNYPLTAGAGLTSAPQYTSMTEDWAGRDVPVPAVTTYSVNNNATPRTTSVTLPNGNTIRQSSYNHPGVWDDGLLYQVETISPANATLAKSNTVWALGDYGSPQITEAYSTDELQQTTKQTFDYANNLYNQVTTASEFGFSNNLLRKKIMTYENGTNYTGNYTGSGTGRYWSNGQHVFSLVKTEEVQDASNNRLQRTDYTYDGAPLVDTPNVVNYDQDYGVNPNYYHNSATLYRGNVTKTTVYADAQNLAGAIPYDSTYDITGNARTITTNCCQQMSFTYTTNTQYSQPETHTKGSSDPNSPDRMTESAIYDFNTGVPVHTTDFNGRQSTHHYDVTLRPTQTILPSGGKQTTVYDDTNLSVTETTQLADNTVAAKSFMTTNGRRQTVVSQQWTGTNWNASMVKYDVLGRTAQASLPYDAGGQPSQWTSYAYDQLSRVVQVTAPDGSQSKTFYNETQKPDSASVYPGNYVRSQDAWGRERWARTDDFGRLAEVVEPNPSGSGSVFEAGSLATFYHHDPADQLVGVTQGAQTRAFAYDSLGRLTLQKLSEQNASLNAAGQFVGAGGAGAQWSDAFIYDARSNLIQRTDARGVKTNFNYQSGGGGPDPLNRLQSVTYDKSGADATYPVADVAPVVMEYLTTGDKTRVGKVTSAFGWTEENGYDLEGRISEYKVTSSLRPAEPLVTSYLYDTVNRLTEVRYPNQWGVAGAPRKVIAPGYDETSRLKELKVDNQIQMSEIVYNPMSQVNSLKTGAATANPDVETYSYDQQTTLLTNQKVIKQNSSQTLMDLSYEYNRGASNGNLSGKTGQLTHIVNNLDRSKDRVFEFDTLGRLRTAKGGGATGVQGVTANWTQNYQYDRFGNRQTVTPAGVTANSQAVPSDGLQNLSYDQSSNRITTAGYTYDLAGNLVRGQDSSGNFQRYEYDAAGRLAVVKDDNGTPLLSNYYTSGRGRIASINNTSTDITIYAWGGAAVIAEYATSTTNNQATSQWKKSYIYAGSRLLSTITNNGSGGETLEFQHPDRLGTKLITNNTANTSFEQSTLPFGTALDAETSGTTNQRFTSYDRSAVANLDYAVNRSYSPAQSRFTSVDPIGMSATSIGNPQSMNLYAYVQNNPIDYTDPSGLFTQGKKPKDDAPVLPPEIVTVPISFDDDPISWGGGGGSGFVRYLPILRIPTEIGIRGGGGLGGETSTPPAEQKPQARPRTLCQFLMNDGVFLNLAERLWKKGGNSSTQRGTEAAALYGFPAVDDGSYPYHGIAKVGEKGGGAARIDVSWWYGEIVNNLGKIKYEFAVHTHPSGNLNPSTPANNAEYDSQGGDTTRLEELINIKGGNKDIKGVIVTSHRFSVWDKNGKIICTGKW